MRNQVEARPIPGYEGLYSITEQGDVFSFHGESMHMMTPYRIAQYHYVKLSINGEHHNKAVHRLVLETFVGPCPDRYDGAHLDGNSDNNALLNLKWVTRKENCEHNIAHGKTQRGDKHWLRTRPEDCPVGEKHGRARFTNEQVREIKSGLTGARGECVQLAKRFGVPYWTMRNIVTGHRWSQVTVGE